MPSIGYPSAFGEAGTPFEREKDPLIKRETLELVRAYCKLRETRVRKRIDVPAPGRVLSRVVLDRTEQCCGVCLLTSLLGRIGIMFARPDDLPAVPARDRATSLLTPDGDSGPIYGAQEFPVAKGHVPVILFRVASNQIEKRQLAGH